MSSDHAYEKKSGQKPKLKPAAGGFHNFTLAGILQLAT
jgi:hypothetical protein